MRHLEGSVGPSSGLGIAIPVVRTAPAVPARSWAQPAPAVMSPRLPQPLGRPGPHGPGQLSLGYPDPSQGWTGAQTPIPILQMEPRFRSAVQAFSGAGVSRDWP